MWITIIQTTLTNLLNSLVPSLPATRIKSLTPPGWNFKYGVILYTLPWIAVHASSGLLCFLSSSRVTLQSSGTPYWSSMTVFWSLLLFTLKSFPEAFKLAQSKGEWPGSNMTFSRPRGCLVAAAIRRCGPFLAGNSGTWRTWSIFI